MQVEHAEFEHLDPSPSPRWVMRIRIIGENFEQRAIPIVAQVGDQAVEGLMPLFEGNGVQGFLTAEPAVGDELRVGYADSPLIATGITYNRPAA
jgi:hypothetical protein